MNSDSLAYVESLYAAYRRDPESVDAAWRRYFESNGDFAPAGWRPAADPMPVAPPATRNGGASGRASEPAAAADGESLAATRLQDRVDQLIRGYRVRGHLAATIDPLGLPRPGNPELELATWGLDESSLDESVSTKSIPGPDRRTLRQIVEHLRETYCRSIGAQFMHIDDREPRFWLQDRMETSRNHLDLSWEQQVRILTRLTDAEIFEAFTRRKFVGAKTFSLEGAESLIPLLDLAFEKAGDAGVQEIVMGMAHRGRLNVLANILGKREKNIFIEFDDSALEDHERVVDDVRYHLGYSGTWTCQSGRELHLSLCFNPSHLEFVSPVAIGRMRAKQDRFRDAEHRQGLTVLIHGDAAFAGEGVVQETLNLSQLPGYATGGTLHVIVNNQIGFTTEPAEGRSTTYASDVAKMLQIPILHVNGEDPEAVAQVVELAMDFRAQFQRDVIIDMYCYRRLGHNEGDEPRFTQPEMYAAIDARKSVRDSYLDRLSGIDGVDERFAEALATQRRDKLEREFEATQTEEFVSDYSEIEKLWSGYAGGREPEDDEPDTGIDVATQRDVLRRLAQVPEGFAPHRKLSRLLDQRREMARGDRPLDYGAAEGLAFATLSMAGIPVRLTGQDAERGTFSHRHAVLHDVNTGERTMPLRALSDDQAPIEIYNSPLSEVGVMGFEYGYSLDYPDALVAWEAQFGDFWNTAQVIVDQFIASAEEKWNRLSGLVLLLPHGYEGQGPEHSSARPERLLQLSTDRNIQVAYPTTPAQAFHLLRRQALRSWRKPLFVLTPKSLLRHPEAVSSMAELARGPFQRVIPDTRKGSPPTRRILACTGKVYWDLAARREEVGADDVAIVRVEQLAPFPIASLRAALEPYETETPIYWVQEEPRNMGFWHYMKLKSQRRSLGEPLLGITRPVSSSPATGSLSTHRREQEELLDAAFAD
jgi:2-oxoglutarate dehydrogenase E1 component